MTHDLWTKEELEKASGATLGEQVEVQGVSIDSRHVQEGDLFVAIKGERFNGHDYVAGSFDQGAVAALVSEAPKGLKDDIRLLHVEDTLKGLEKLGAYRREQMQGKVLGITGSVGKTSTKEMMAHALSALGRTHATLGNLNNHIGLPLTLSRMPKNTEYAVIEMGINHPGEMQPLTTLARPHVAMVTTVASVHLEHFDSEQEIAREKAQIFLALEEDGVAVMNRDNVHYDFMCGLVDDFKVRKVVTFGKHQDADARLVNYSENEKNQGVVDAKIHGEPLNFVLGVAGEHMAMNAVGVLASIHAAGADVKQAAKALETYQAKSGRGKVEEVVVAGKTLFVMDDSYNASPMSVAAGLKNLTSFAKHRASGRTIAVLGDMFELGESAPQLHASLAKNIVENHIDLVFTAGELMRHLHEAIPANQQGEHYKNAEEAGQKLQAHLQTGDILLVKGSRGMQMEKVIQQLKG